LLLSAIAFFCCAAVSADQPKLDSNDAPSAHVRTIEAQPDALRATNVLPDAPIAKVDASPAESFVPGSEPALNGPVKPAARGSFETPRQRKIWWTLVAAGHSAAVFDAYTTRAAISGNYGTEGDPFMRPFSHSDAMYAATQASPALLDVVGRRMMTSHHETLRRFWWLPQTVGVSSSLAAAIHNHRIVQ
jgi:hypothetical protein